MTERPRLSIIGYGSILNLAEIEESFETIDGRVTPIRVDGFKRIFNQEASWRETSEEQRAVLNVVPSEDGWFNGVLISDLSRSEFLDLRERERGYRLIEVEKDQIEPYDPDEIEAGDVDVDFSPEQDLVLTTTGEKVDESISPIPEYVDICREGAEMWGDVFFEDFVETTESNPGTSLSLSSE